MIEVRSMRKIEKVEGTLRAFADGRVGDVLIKGCRVVQGNKGLFVSTPQAKGKDEKWYPIVVIESDALYKDFQAAVLAAYNGTAVVEPPAVVKKTEEDF